MDNNILFIPKHFTVSAASWLFDQWQEKQSFFTIEFEDGVSKDVVKTIAKLMYQNKRK